MAFVEAGLLEDLPNEQGKQLSLGGVLVSLYRCGDDVYAISDICTHEEAYLSEGDFDCDDLEVECPLHGSRFDVRDGSVRILPATKPVRTYDVKIEDGRVLVSSDPR